MGACLVCICMCMHALFPSGDEDQFSSSSSSRRRRRRRRDERRKAICLFHHARKRTQARKEKKKRSLSLSLSLLVLCSSLRVCVPLWKYRKSFPAQPKSHFIFFPSLCAILERREKKKGSREACDGVHQYFNTYPERAVMLGITERVQKLGFGKT